MKTLAIPLKEGATAGLPSSVVKNFPQKHCWTSQQWHTTLAITSAALLFAAATVWADEPAPANHELLEVPVIETPAVEDPAVQAIVETKPTTPAELIRAAKILAELHRADLAKEYLAKVLAANLSRQELAALEAEFGSPIFLQLAAREDLAPEGQKLTDAVLAAAVAERADPSRVAEWIGQLQDASPAVRIRAADELRRVGGTAVGPLVDVLADPERKAEHAAVLATLVALGADAVGPLAAMIDDADPPRKVAAVRALAEIKAPQAAIYLVAPRAAAEDGPYSRSAAEGGPYGRSEAAAVLARRAKSLLDHSEPLPADADDRVTVWTWDATTKQPVAETVSRDDAYRRKAARLARDAYAIAPDDPQVRLIYLAAILEEAVYTTGLDSPLATAAGSPTAEAAGDGVAALEDLLEYAMGSGYWAAATTAARLLGEHGTAAELLYGRAEPSPLVMATRHADRRLRFAALATIVKLAPSEPYAGSSQVLEAIGYFAATTGTRRALVASLSSEEAARVAGYLAGLGYDVDTATSGKGLVRLALRSPDYELALVDSALRGPTPELLLQELRRDGRTAGLPVGILARSNRYYEAEEMAAEDPLAAATARPHEVEAVEAIVGRLVALSGPRMVSHDLRQQQAAAALAWLADLSDEDQTLYNMWRIEDDVLAPLYVPKLGLTAAVVLGNLGTPRSQQALVDVASRCTLPLELRQAAANALETSVSKHGILLTGAQILRQYDRYNESAPLDRDTQRVLGSILDAIERRG